MNKRISENAIKVLERRYLKKDINGNVCESPLEMFQRVAREIASVDKQYKKNKKAIKQLEDSFLSMMTNLEFLPNSPTLMNAGCPLGQLSACFVLPVEDSMESIFETLKTTAIIHKSGGGTGFSFSRLREKNSFVKKTGGVASGPISFIKVFDAATQAVKQGGTRRGANMAILRVDHPDILEFITCKEKDKEICNFNISVGITDKFWQAYINNENYALISPYSKKVVRTINAQYVFDLIIENAHRNGEPGIIFLDKMNAMNPTPAVGTYEATNPCGEQVLLPYESCNLGSINLVHMLAKKDRGYEIDWDKLKKTVRLAVHFLDNVVDANRHPIKEIEKTTKNTRKIGLGVMGWASLLLRMGIPYNSDQAVDLAKQLMSFIQMEARIKSLELGKEKGVFPCFDKSIFADSGDKQRFRNATLTTIAPTGTISIIGGPCSSGIEPIFAISYYRNVMDNTKLVEVDNIFEEVARERGFYSPELMQKIAENGTIQGIKEIPEDVQKIFVTSHDISPEWHIRMQAAFQEFTDNAVSKTINFPNSAAKKDVRDSYELAYQLNCKGITVYRDGSRDEQVLNITKKSVEPEEKTHVPAPSAPKPRSRPEIISGQTLKVTTGCGNLYITVNRDTEGRPFEAFTQMGKAGGCASSQLEAVARLLSLAMRSGIDTKTIKEQLCGIRCPSPSWNKGAKVLSCADAIAQAVEKLVQHDLPTDKEPQEVLVESKPAGLSTTPVMKQSLEMIKNMVGVCPDCGNPLHHEEGCVKCHGCGYSKC